MTLLLRQALLNDTESHNPDWKAQLDRYPRRCSKLRSDLAAIEASREQRKLIGNRTSEGPQKHRYHHNPMASKNFNTSKSPLGKHGFKSDEGTKQHSALHKPALGFLDLPREVRDMIYGYALYFPEGIRVESLSSAAEATPFDDNHRVHYKNRVQYLNLDAELGKYLAKHPDNVPQDKKTPPSENQVRAQLAEFRDLLYGLRQLGRDHPSDPDEFLKRVRAYICPLATLIQCKAYKFGNGFEMPYWYFIAKHFWPFPAKNMDQLKTQYHQFTMKANKIQAAEERTRWPKYLSELRAVQQELSFDLEHDWATQRQNEPKIPRQPWHYEVMLFGYIDPSHGTRKHVRWFLGAGPQTEITSLDLKYEAPRSSNDPYSKPNQKSFISAALLLTNRRVYQEASEVFCRVNRFALDMSLVSMHQFFKNVGGQRRHFRNVSWIRGYGTYKSISSYSATYSAFECGQYESFFCNLFLWKESGNLNLRTFTIYASEFMPCHGWYIVNRFVLELLRGTFGEVKVLIYREPEHPLLPSQRPEQLLEDILGEVRHGFSASDLITSWTTAEDYGVRWKCLCLTRSPSSKGTPHHARTPRIRHRPQNGRHYILTGIERPLRVLPGTL
ncbi:MAG: hypothetical protein M1822_001203 [Bathelium mastoideum]|nr:MAG: hypothetical protein M1822_001203 [Bathelium mastoideum]